MALIVGVRFQNTDKPYYFETDNTEIKRNTLVIVETEQGMEIGKAISAPKEIIEEPEFELKTILRIATQEDIDFSEETRILADQAFYECKALILELGIEMKVIKAAYTFDRKKLLFYFVADDRIDFRQLVKELAEKYKTRIELRQIGLRDATKKIGGLGSCGRPLCCNTFLSEFKPVSIKMLKEQNIVLNPNQISGHCGRLMCCLQYEHGVYEELNQNAPKVGKKVILAETGDIATVISVNLLKEEAKIMIEKDDDKEVRLVNYGEIKDAKS